MGIKGLGMRARNEGTGWWGTGLRGRGLSVIGAEGHRLRARHGEALLPTEPTEEKGGKKKTESFVWFCFFEIARCGDRKRGRRGGAARSLRGPRRWEARRSRGGSGAASPWLQQTGPDAFVSRHVFREKHNSTAERGQEKERG